MIRNARAYMRFQEMLTELEKSKPYTDASEQNKLPITLEFADPADDRIRFFDFQVAGFLQTNIKESLTEDRFKVLVYLCGIQFVPTCSIGNGISWLELYALFMVQTGQTQAPTIAKAATSLKRRLRDFTSQVRSVVNCFGSQLFSCGRRNGPLQAFHKKRIKVAETWVSTSHASLALHSCGYACHGRSLGESNSLFNLPIH